MSNAELIAEAETRASLLRHPDAPEDNITAHLLGRLASALRECDVPAGWRVTRCEHENGDIATEEDDGTWLVLAVDGSVVDVDKPTAAAAMAALEENE
jgi:hypothetical protein